MVKEKQYGKQYKKNNSMRIEHIAIWADDIELLRDFYIKYFNLTCGDKYTNPAKKFTSYFCLSEMAKLALNS